MEDRIQNVMNGTSELASTRATGACRNNSETVVHLSKINSGTRETGTRVYIYKESSSNA